MRFHFIRLRIGELLEKKATLLDVPHLSSMYAHGYVLFPFPPHFFPEEQNNDSPRCRVAQHGLVSE